MDLEGWEGSRRIGFPVRGGGGRGIGVEDHRLSRWERDWLALGSGDR